MSRKILIFYIVTLFLIIVVCGGSTPEAKTVKKKPVFKGHTIESGLSSNTKKLINKIKKCTKKSATFKCNKESYKELTHYLYSSYYMNYDTKLNVTDVSKVKKRINTVKKINALLLKRAKKLYKGKNLKTINAYQDYISEKMDYKLKNPDMYRSMKRGSCVAYSTMLQIMCKVSGIPCKVYAGWNDDNEGHCWNRVKVNGKWYWSDACWYDNSMYDYEGYLHSRKLWSDHKEYRYYFGVYYALLPY